MKAKTFGGRFLLKSVKAIYPDLTDHNDEFAGNVNAKRGNC